MSCCCNGGGFEQAAGGGNGGASGPAGRLDLTFDPVALYHFDNDLTDSSGNGFDLTVQAGNEKYTFILPGLTAFLFDGLTTLHRATAEALLTITGDLTVEMICMFPDEITVASETLVQHGVAASELEPDNILYTYSFRGDVGFQYLAEEGAGTNIIYNLTTHGPPLCIPMHCGFSRIGDQIQFYLQGRPVGAPSVGLAAPTGGGNGTLHVGAAAGGTGLSESVSLTELKIIPSDIGAAGWLAEYNRTLGPVYGTLT